MYFRELLQKMLNDVITFGKELMLNIHKNILKRFKQTKKLKGFRMIS